MISQADANDLLDVAQRLTDITRCPGGRIVADNGYTCVHCGADFRAGEACGQPRPGFKRAAKRAARKAR